MDWTIVAWIAGLIFVYVFGLVEGRGKGYKKRKAEEEQEKQNQPPSQPKTVTVDDPGLLRIKNEGGSFTLDLDGARVSPISLSSEQRKRLIEILNIMRPWLEGKPAPAINTAPSPPLGKPMPSDQRFDTAAPLSTPVQGRSAPVQPASPPPQRSAPKPATIPMEDRPSAPVNSIVTQIDSILQMRLVGTALEERGVFLTQSPDGGVSVYVGLTRYNGVDEVPDPEIKAAIRAAITEWENKYTPGL